MKAVILAGGLGRVLAKKLLCGLKPMVEIGGKTDPVAHPEKCIPITGIDDFIICSWL